MSVTVQITPVIAEAFLQRVPFEEALKGYPDYADVLRAAWERIPVEKRAGGIAEQPKQSLPQAPQQQLPEPREWEIPAHREVDPFDPEYDEVMATVEAKSVPVPEKQTPGGTGRFLQIALQALERNPAARILPIAVGGKQPLSSWKGSLIDTATTEEWIKKAPQWVAEFAEKFPDVNACVLAKPNELVFVDCDSMREFREGYEKFSGEQFPETYTTSARDNRCQIHFLQTDRTREMGNVHQFAVDGVDLSVRQHNLYVLAEGSQHPTGSEYRRRVDHPVVPMPDKMVEYIQHLEKQAYQPTIRTSAGSGATDKWVPIDISVEGAPIPRGQHDTTLFKIACSLRQRGWEEQSALDHLIQVCQARCVNHGSDYVDMCAKKIKSAWKYEVKEPTPVVFNAYGHQPAPANIQLDLPKFVSVGELEHGEVQMLIDGFLPEGTTFIGGLPGEGKTFFALSIARALTTGKPFLNAFNVPKTIPVIYLIPESGGRAFRKRCEKFEIPDDPDLFLCRTVSQGATLPLDDASLLEAVARLKPVVILDTIIRFSESEDENAAAQNKKLVDDVIRLRQAGAVAVIGLHHAAKAMREKGMSLELALRGTGDIAATADAVYGLLRDNMLYKNGSGPNEIQVACLKPRDFEPPEPFRIAASSKVSGSDIPDDGRIRIVSSTESIIDQQHDFQLVSRMTHASQVDDRIEKLVLETPTVTLKELNEVTGISVWEIRRTLERLGYHRGRGGKKGATHWTKEPEKVDRSTIRADVNLDAVAA